MKRVVAAGLLLTAFALSSPAAAQNWSGVYFGMSAGGNAGSSNTTTDIVNPTTFFGVCPACLADFTAKRDQRFGTSGFNAGVHGGYNWQSGNFVAGFEVELGYFRSTGSHVYSAGLQTPGLINTQVSTNWLLTARPRLGIVANNALFYGTGGVAVTDINAS